MKPTLKKAMKSQSLCEIYTNTEQTDKFAVGYVLSLDEQNCVVSLVGFYGEYDGLACFSIDEIYKIQSRTKYLQAIEKLINFKGKTVRNCFFQDHILVNILSDIKDKHRICQIELCDSDSVDITGYVNDVDTKNLTVEICLIDELGNNDGCSVVDMQMISYLSYDSNDTIRLEILNK